MDAEREREIRERFKNNWCRKGNCYCDEPFDAVRDLLAALDAARAQAEALVVIAQDLIDNSKQTDQLENEWSYGPVMYCDPNAWFNLQDKLAAYRKGLSG